MFRGVRRLDVGYLVVGITSTWLTRIISRICIDARLLVIVVDLCLSSPYRASFGYKPLQGFTGTAG
jgi:hypothetical protein